MEKSNSSVFRKIADEESIATVVRHLIQILNESEKNFESFDQMDKSDFMEYLRKVSKDIETSRWRRY